MGMDKEVHENQANENESTNPAEKVENYFRLHNRYNIRPNHYEGNGNEQVWEGYDLSNYLEDGGNSTSKIISNSNSKFLSSYPERITQDLINAIISTEYDDLLQGTPFYYTTDKTV